MNQKFTICHQVINSVSLVSLFLCIKTVNNNDFLESSVVSTVGPSASMAPPPSVRRRTGLQTKTQKMPSPPKRKRPNKRVYWTDEENELLLKGYRKYGRKGTLIRNKYLPNKKVQSVLDRFKTLENNGELPSL